jgi:hypothetical protein
VTVAPEHSKSVFAFTEDAQIVKHVAFVYIDTRLVVPLVRVHKPHLAFAPERTRIIETLSVLAEIGVVQTLVDVHAVVPVPFEPGVTLALERTVGVDALSVLVAPAVVRQTFVDVSATDAVSGESVLASALVRARIIYAICVDVAVERSQEALVVVAARRAPVGLDRVAVFAPALERPQSVDAFATPANVWILLALVDVQAGCSTGSGK